MANQTVTVLEADGTTSTDVEVLGFGRQAAAASKSTAMSTEDKAVLDAMAASLVTIDGRVDGLEALIGTTNTTLTTIDGRVDGLETLIGSTNTKLDTAITALQTIDSPDKGVGTGGSETQRVILDSSQFAPSTDFVSGTTSAMTGTTTTSLVAAPGASLHNYITTIIVSNAHATVGTDVIIQDGSGGTTLLTIPAAAVYGGATITLPTPLRQPTANTELFCANVTTGASTKVSAVGYKAA